ncbi:methyl-accepting chemotaxis protein [Marinobacter nanhaiticus D15-8W]|uniref:Methyl-accepting chemotaxis protein n=1 Tax=Marinobacter nanhaiticus D15-8W TaxID=626887 RepID=N6VRJ5_9GAMM|nr:methyl-accepting chemotaxis protein [Marinobacter nanhaiticus]ENO12805.1 methyl-accepting chemotaxis protein [Marinobacter nanhaiticus D15-8W]BES70153.1 methyl-accepting chemotaxis protein [Marinobacter nanhaiticus D15-8W]
MQALKDLAIGTKILALAAVLLVLLGAVAAFAIVKVAKVGNEFHAIATEDMPLVELVSDVTVKQLEKAILLEKLFRVGGVDTREGVSIQAIRRDIVALGRTVDIEIRDAEVLIEKAKAHAPNAAIAAEIDALAADLKNAELEHTAFEEEFTTLFAALDAGDMAEANRLARDIEVSRMQLGQHLEAILKGIEQMTSHTLAVVEQDEQALLHGLIVISAISIVVGIVIGLLIARSITRPLKRAVDAANALAEGDLTVDIRVDSKDETGVMLDAMRRMAQSLRSVIGEIDSSILQLSASAEELSAITTQTRASVDSQQEAIAQTATATHEMTTTIHDVARNASQAAESTQSAERAARSGQREVEGTRSAMDALATKMRDAFETIGQLERETDNVGNILGVIQGIAEQTNLLALNAAIEAARAGEQGRGFAVVADEVRTLASRTQTSTREIHTMIERLQGEARASVSIIQGGQSDAAGTVQKAVAAESLLEEIAGAVTRISDMNMQIASAAEQQHIVAEDISRSIERINQSADETAGGAQQTEIASAELANLAGKLQEMMGRFKTA